MPLGISEILAKLKQVKVTGGGGGNYLRLDPDKPVYVFVLPTPDDLFFRQIATHWLTDSEQKPKRVNCSNPDGEHSCFICDQIVAEEAALASAKAKAEHEAKANPEAAQKQLQAIRAAEETLGRIKSRKAYAFNILERGAENPKIFESPWGIFNTIYAMYLSSANEYSVDITDPLNSTIWKLTRTGSGKFGTKYTASPSPKAQPIFQGTQAEVEEKIARLYSVLPDLAKLYRYPEKAELQTAWGVYLNGEESAEAKAPPPPKTPPSMSKIGGKPAKAKAQVVEAPPEPEIEPEPEPDEGEDPDDLNMDPVPDDEEAAAQEELEPKAKETPSKPKSVEAVSKLLNRLKV
jgi:hypothetical protein